MAVPAAPGSYFLFTQHGVELHNGTATTAVEGVSSSAGMPMAKAFDTESAMACVAYSKAVVFLDLSSERIRGTIPHALGKGIRGVSIREGSAMVWSDRTAVLVGENGTVKDWDMSVLLKAKGVERIEYCFPVGPKSMLLIASRSASTFSDGETICMLLDRSSGPWMPTNSNSLGASLSEMQSVGSEGSRIYVTGLFDKVQLSTGRGGRLYQDVLVFRIDLGSLEATEVMRSPRQQKNNNIAEMAVGPDSISLLFYNGTLQVFKVNEGQRATTPTYDGFFEGAHSIAWVSENEILVTTGEQSELIQFQ